jgi:hypothetical protein
MSNGMEDEDNMVSIIVGYYRSIYRVWEHFRKSLIFQYALPCGVIHKELTPKLSNICCVVIFSHALPGIEVG